MIIIMKTWIHLDEGTVKPLKYLSLSQKIYKKKYYKISTYKVIVKFLQITDSVKFLLTKALTCKEQFAQNNSYSKSENNSNS